MGLYVIPRRVAWFDTVQGRVDALATMSLMQMISDAYESAHDMWEHDEESNSTSPPLNEAQEAVRAWLAYARFLPPLPPKQLPRALSIPSEASSSTLLNSPPKTPNKKWRLSMGSLRLSRKRTHSGSPNFSSPSLSLVSLSPSKLWRRRRESTTSFTTVSEQSGVSTPLSTPSKSSSRPLPIRSFTTPTFKKRPRFPTKIPYRQGSTSDEVQESPSPQSLTRAPPPNPLTQSVFHPPSNTPTRRSIRTLSFDGATSTTPWLTRSFSSPSLRSSSPSSSESPPWSAQKPAQDNDLSQDRPPDVTLWTLFVITMLGYLFFFFLFLGCFLLAICKLFKIFWTAADE